MNMNTSLGRVADVGDDMELYDTTTLPVLVAQLTPAGAFTLVLVTVYSLLRTFYPTTSTLGVGVITLIALSAAGILTRSGMVSNKRRRAYLNHPARHRVHNNDYGTFA